MNPKPLKNLETQGSGHKIYNGLDYHLTKAYLLGSIYWRVNIT